MSTGTSESPAQVHADVSQLKKELADALHVANGGRAPRQETADKSSASDSK
jgi:hypothetical protein